MCPAAPAPVRSAPSAAAHHRVWPLCLRLASLPGCPAPTAICVHRRYFQFDPSHAEDVISYLISAWKFREAADHIAAVINDNGFFSIKSTSKHQLLLHLCDLVTQHPKDIAGLPVEAILHSAIRKIPKEASVLWTTLAGYFVRKGLHDKERDVFEEGTTTAVAVMDFRLVFEAYLHFEHALVSVREEHDEDGENGNSTCWLADHNDTDLAMARLERLLNRRSELLNSV
jgi:pre-mRNA-splicing factor SYF1